VILGEEQDALRVKIPFSNEAFISGVAKKKVLASYMHLYLPSMRKGEDSWQNF